MTTLNPGEVDRRVQVAVAAQLKLMRAHAGLSQRDIYVRTGILRPVVSMIERGAQCPTLHVAQRFAAACGGSLQDVLAAIDGALQERAVDTREGANGEE